MDGDHRIEHGREELVTRGPGVVGPDELAERLEREPHGEDVLADAAVEAQRAAASSRAALRRAPSAISRVLR
ncbi:hypothetical protein [Archangium sp.]|uniref:hypothetical protein n=1 Tax=Archangium sp. TaxID=1872627 RepID=UPI002D287F14|nr:hypothetical protein [Archangium sp.]HYO52607.1 hypothetical protein [Archangium sp.]